MSLRPWREERTLQEAHHFNRAYCGVLVYEFVRSYQNSANRPVSFPLVFCALPIALHPETRKRLPKSIVTRLFPWIESNSDVLVGFSDRARNLSPYVRDAIRYAADRQAVCFNKGGTITIGPKRASYTRTALTDTTEEIRSTVDAIRKIGRWFAAAGDTSTILAAWGIRV